MNTLKKVLLVVAFFAATGSASAVTVQQWANSNRVNSRVALSFIRGFHWWRHYTLTTNMTSPAQRRLDGNLQMLQNLSGQQFQQICQPVPQSASGIKKLFNWWRKNVGYVRTIGMGALVYNFIKFYVALNNQDFVTNLSSNSDECARYAMQAALSLVPVIGWSGTKKIIKLLTCGCLG